MKILTYQRLKSFWKFCSKTDKSREIITPSQEWFTNFLNENQNQLTKLTNLNRTLLLIKKIFIDNQSPTAERYANIPLNDIFHSVVGASCITAHEILFEKKYKYSINKLFSKKRTILKFTINELINKQPIPLIEIFPCIFKTGLADFDPKNPSAIMHLDRLSSITKEYNKNNKIWFHTLQKWRVNCFAHIGPYEEPIEIGRGLMIVISEVIEFISSLLNIISLALCDTAIEFKSNSIDELIEKDLLKFLALPQMKGHLNRS